MSVVDIFKLLFFAWIAINIFFMIVAVIIYHKNNKEEPEENTEDKASVDKVAEQLEEAMNDANMRSGDYEDYDDYEQGRATAFEEAIDIVKQNLTD